MGDPLSLLYSLFWEKIETCGKLLLKLNEIEFLNFKLPPLFSLKMCFFLMHNMLSDLHQIISQFFPSLLLSHNQKLKYI